MFKNHALRLGLHVAVKLNFRPYIRRYTSPNENFEYNYPLILCLIFPPKQNVMSAAVLFDALMDIAVEKCWDQRVASLRITGGTMLFP